MQIYLKKQYYFQGLELVLEREKRGLTQVQFAEQAGWTQQQQSKMEAMIDHSITPEIEAGFKKLGIFLEYATPVV